MELKGRQPDFRERKVMRAGKHLPGEKIDSSEKY